MRFVIISKSGSALPMALRLAREGHEVNIYIDDVVIRQRAYEGIRSINKIDRKELHNLADQKEYIKIFDQTGLGDWADKLMARHHGVIGSGSIADKIENDRDFGMKTMASVAIKTPPTKKFTDFKTAITFVEQNPTRYVFKPSIDKKSSIITSFELQKFLSGITVETEGWWNGEKFVTPYNGELEEKKYANDDEGPMVGQAGTVVWAHKNPNPKIAAEGINKLAPVLKQHPYYGPICLNTIIRGRELFGLEFTARFGYDSIYALGEGLHGSLAEVFMQLAHGQMQNLPLITDQFFAGARVSIPPYPIGSNAISTYVSSSAEDMIQYLKATADNPLLVNTTNYLWLKPGPDAHHMTIDKTLDSDRIWQTASENLRIGGIEDEDEKHIHWFDIKTDDQGRPMTAGTDGHICTVTHAAGNIDGAVGNMYGIIRALSIPNRYVRTDIGKRARDDYDELKDAGWFD